MTHLPHLRGFLRTLVGLPERSGLFWGIDRSVANDIERARFRRAMRESAQRSAEYVGRFHRDPAFRAAEIQRLLDKPPPSRRPVLYSPDAYRELVARAGGSLRPEAERRRRALESER